MRTFQILTLAGGLLLSAGVCHADEPDRSATGPCVDVQIGNERSTDLNCINQRLRSFSAQQQAVTLGAPISARSSSTAVGTANIAAAQQKMGNAFGKSAIPQRPQPVFISPLVGLPAAH